MPIYETILCEVICIKSVYKILAQLYKALFYVPSFIGQNHFDEIIILN